MANVSFDLRGVAFLHLFDFGGKLYFSLGFEEVAPLLKVRYFSLGLRLQVSDRLVALLLDLCLECLALLLSLLELVVEHLLLRRAQVLQQGVLQFELF